MALARSETHFWPSWQAMHERRPQPTDASTAEFQEAGVVWIDESAKVLHPLQNPRSELTQERPSKGIH